MPDADWDGLKTALAVARAGSLAGAARALGVNETTVARRIARLEAALGARLFERDEGRVAATPEGAAVAAEAARMELAAEAAADAAAGADETPAGLVRVTAAPVIVQRLLIPRLAALTERWPELRLELLGDAANRSLLNREADIALRLARPEAEPQAVARKLADLDYAVYARAEAGEGAGDGAPWLGYAEAFQDRSPAQWQATAADAAHRAAAAFDGAEALLAAIRAGLGKGFLPRFVGDREPALRRLAAAPAWSRPLWMILHPETRDRARIRVVADWLKDAVNGRAPPPGRRPTASGPG